MATKKRFKNWYKKNGYSERGGHTRFCKAFSCPKGTLSGWLNDKDPSPLPWVVSLIMEIDIENNLNCQSLRKSLTRVKF
jgi:hypothetical protein